ncbi:MAG TPA: MarR family transcriptional regulator [Coriobacteriia bacterium]|nr:MarR family transcriptional regulator [Coriobacteriia bacterium]
MISGARGNTERLDDLELDSTYLIAFDMAHSALKNGLTSVSSLNITQYHALIKTFAAGEKGLSQTDIGLKLDVKPNVVSHIISLLEGLGFVQRTKSDEGDGRVRLVRITEAGTEHADGVNKSIIEQLYATFPTQNDVFRSILEASIIAGAHIDPPISEETVSRFPASRALVSLELIRRTFEATLRRLAGVSFNEYRVLQRMCELDMPLRSVDLANQLRMTPPTIARAADQLVSRAFATRLGSPTDKKAVFLAATETGKHKQKAISDTIDSLARNYLWKNLNREQRHAIAQVGHVVIAQLREKEEAERKAALSLLKPIG